MSDKQSTPQEREWAEGPEGEQDVLRYISDTPALLSMLYDLDLLPEQHPDPESKEREQIFIIANHWREDHLSERGEKLYTKADAEVLCEIAKAAGIKLAREATLEECAKLAEERYAEVAWHPDYRIAANSIAFTIRKLKVTA